MQYRLLKLAMYTIVLNLLFVPFNSSIAAIFGYCTIVISILYPLVNSYRNGKITISRLAIWLMLLVVISALTSASDFELKNLQPYIVLSASFVAMYWSLSITSGKKNIGGLWLEDLYTVNYVLCIIFIAFAFGPFDFKYMQVNKWGDMVFTMGLGNPNTVAVHVMFSVVLLVMQNFDEYRKVRKAINWCLIFALITILFKLSSRTVMVSVIAVLACVVLRLRKKNALWVSYIAILLPIIFVGIQPLLANEQLGQILGKKLQTGRGEIFSDFFKDFLENPHHFVFGRLFKYKFDNYHNAPITVLANVGVGGLVAYFVFWFGHFKRLNDSCEDKIQFAAWLSLVAFMIHSSSEVMMMIGMIPYGTYIVILTEIAKGNIRSKRIESMHARRNI